MQYQPTPAVQAQQIQDLRTSSNRHEANIDVMWQLVRELDCTVTMLKEQLNDVRRELLDIRQDVEMLHASNCCQGAAAWHNDRRGAVGSTR